jgi:polysaccharide export outer membrane protein
MVMMSSVFLRRALGVACVGLATICQPGLAQSVSAVPLNAQLETREVLETQLRDADAAHRTSEAWLLRTRLQKGDFQDGDRIVVALLGTIPYNDTLTVRAGKMLPLPRMGDLPLDGVLRSELTERLSSHIAKYLRDSSVKATPLLRLAVMGFISKPGYYYTAADVLLNDVIMKAGGPISESDMNNLIITRSGETIWTAQDTRTALTDGISLERLHLRAGDELHVGEVGHGFNWQLYLQALGAIGSLFFLYHEIRP